jgi:hypothetical protein
MKIYNFFAFGVLDEYGQPQLSEESQGTIKISIFPTSQVITDNIKYKEASYIGLTHNNSVNDSWVIEYGEVKLKVLYVNPEGRLNQVFMKEI